MVQMMCSDGIINCLKESGIYSIDDNKTICTECHAIFHDKHEQWSHTRHKHIIITFEQSHKKYKNSEEAPIM